MFFTQQLVCPEGPVALEDGTWLCVQGEPAGCITHISANGGEKRVVAITGRPNGLAVDKDGFIWCAESRIPSLLRVSFSGETETILTGCGDEAFLFPNDLCFGPDGWIYLTDSGVFIDDFAPGGKVRADYEAVVCDGRVYRVHPVTREIQKIDSGIQFTNGIAIGPDGYLYTNETLTGNIYRYRLGNGKTGPREFFGNVINPEAAPGYKGPDGMAFDQNGLLYVAVFGQGDITVMNSVGEVVKRIATLGKNPTNLAFALPSKKQMLVTEYENGVMELHPVDTGGLDLYK